MGEVAVERNQGVVLKLDLLRIQSVLAPGFVVSLVGGHEHLSPDIKQS